VKATTQDGILTEHNVLLGGLAGIAYKTDRFKVQVECHALTEWGKSIGTVRNYLMTVLSQANQASTDFHITLNTTKEQ
jgi:hypothetical protein